VCLLRSITPPFNRQMDTIQKETKKTRASTPTTPRAQLKPRPLIHSEEMVTTVYTSYPYHNLHVFLYTVGVGFVYLKMCPTRWIGLKGASIDWSFIYLECMKLEFGPFDPVRNPKRFSAISYGCGTI